MRTMYKQQKAKPDFKAAQETHEECYEGLRIVVNKWIVESSWFYMEHMMQSFKYEKITFSYYSRYNRRDYIVIHILFMISNSLFLKYKSTMKIIKDTDEWIMMGDHFYAMKHQVVAININKEMLTKELIDKGVNKSLETPYHSPGLYRGLESCMGDGNEIGTPCRFDRDKLGPLESNEKQQGSLLFARMDISAGYYKNPMIRTVHVRQG